MNEMLPKLPADLRSGILIVQHMPPAFTGPFARRLDSLSSISVKEAENGELVECGCAYIAPGGVQMKVRNETGSSSKLRINLSPDPSDTLFIPSVDVMKLSVSKNFKDTILGVIMTGMGDDGLQGMTSIKKNGGFTIAQDEDSCVVYGMPRACVEKEIIDNVCNLDKLPGEIIKFAG